MTKAEIETFKGYVRDVLVKRYDMGMQEADKAIKNSYLSEALKKDPDYVEGDTVEEWAEAVFVETIPDT